MKDYAKILSPSALRLLDLIRMEGPARLDDLRRYKPQSVIQELLDEGLATLDGEWLRPATPMPHPAPVSWWRRMRAPLLEGAAVGTAVAAILHLAVWAWHADAHLWWALSLGVAAWILAQVAERVRPEGMVD